MFAFKTPQKRRLKQQHTGKQTKKDRQLWFSQSETESESDFSECSVHHAVYLKVAFLAGAIL